jgi:LysM repeat protein
MATFEEFGKNTGKDLDNRLSEWKKAAENTAKSIENSLNEAKVWAINIVDRIGKWFNTAVDSITESAKRAWNKVSSTINEGQDRITATGEQLKVWATNAINTTAKQVSSIEEWIKSGTLIFVQKGWEVFVRTKNAAGESMDLAMKTVKDGKNEALTIINDHLQRTVDTVTEYKNGAMWVARAAKEATKRMTEPVVAAWKDGVDKWNAAKAKGETVKTPEVIKTPDTYIIMPGDTLSKIAKTNGWNNPNEYLKWLLEANPKIDANKLNIGQQINLPKKTA